MGEAQSSRSCIRENSVHDTFGQNYELGSLGEVR